MEPSLTGLFGMNREMGYTRREFSAKLPAALSDYDFAANGDVVTIALGPGEVKLHVGIERERRLSELVSFPVLPVTIECIGVDPSSQASFIRQFEIAYFKGLG